MPTESRAMGIRHIYKFCLKCRPSKDVLQLHKRCMAPNFYLVAVWPCQIYMLAGLVRGHALMHICVALLPSTLYRDVYYIYFNQNKKDISNKPLCFILFARDSAFCPLIHFLPNVCCINWHVVGPDNHDPQFLSQAHCEIIQRKYLFQRSSVHLPLDDHMKHFLWVVL